MVRCSGAEEQDCNLGCHHREPHEPHEEGCNCGCCGDSTCTESDYCVDIGDWCKCGPIHPKEGETP